MWNIEERFDNKVMESLPKAGFTVRSTRGVVRVERYGCAAEFRRAAASDGHTSSDEQYQMTLPPAILLGGQFTRLWDAGYQKFLLTDDGRKIPAHADQLSNLRRFNEELRTALGIPTYYNEALGSTCQVSTYDRVKGRRGDVPDASVGAKTSQPH